MVEDRGTSAHLIVNPASGNAAAFLGQLTRAARDGEPVALEAPLRFSVDPGALRLLVPDEIPANRQPPPLEAGWHAARTLGRWLRPSPAAHEAENEDPRRPTDRGIP